MFVLLGLLAWPERLPQRLLPALAVAADLDADRAARRRAACLAPFRFSFRKSCSSTGSACAGAVSVFLASIPMLVDCPARIFTSTSPSSW